MKRRHLVGMLATLVSGTSPAQSLPPGCNADLVHQARSARLPQAYSTRGAYCDGRVPVPSSGTFLLLGVEMGSTTSPALAAAGSLRLHLPTEAVIAYGAGPHSLSGQAVDLGGSWRLDGRLTSAGLGIDRRVALLPMGLDETKVGFVVRVRSASGEILPVTVSGTSPEAVWLILRAPAPLRVVRLSVSGGGQPDYQRSVANDVEAGKVLRIKLNPEPRSTLRSVRVVASDPSNERYTFSGAIFVPRSR